MFLRMVFGFIIIGFQGVTKKVVILVIRACKIRIVLRVLLKVHVTRCCIRSFFSGMPERVRRRVILRIFYGSFNVSFKGSFTSSVMGALMCSIETSRMGSATYWCLNLRIPI